MNARIYQLFLQSSVEIYSDVLSIQIISLIEIVKETNLNNFSIKNDGLIVNFIVKSLNNKKVDLFRKYVMKLKETLELNLDMVLDGSYYEYESEIIIEDLINHLPSLQKRVLREKFLYGYSYKEIGDRLNITRQAVNGIKNRALNNLRKLI